MKQNYLIAIIIVAGISISAVSAYSGVISAGTGLFNNLTVTGTCTGCGGGEGSFSSWNTIALNETLTNGNSYIPVFLLSNLGDSILSGSNNQRQVSLSGTTVFKNGTTVAGVLLRSRVIRKFH